MRDHPEQGRRQEADRRLVRDHGDRASCVAKDDRSDDGQCTRDDGDAGLPALRREREGILLPLRVLLRKTLLDLLARELLPAPMIDLAEAVLDADVEAMRLGDDRGGVARSLE